VKELKETAILTDYSKNSPVILWLWEILEAFTEVQKATFHYFITGFEIKEDHKFF